MSYIPDKMEYCFLLTGIIVNDYFLQLFFEAITENLILILL